MTPTWTYSAIKQYVNKYWDSDRNTAIPVDNSNFVSCDANAKQKKGSANEYSKRTYRKTCDFVLNTKKGSLLCHTHNTDKCLLLR